MPATPDESERVEVVEKAQVMAEAEIRGGEYAKMANEIAEDGRGAVIENRDVYGDLKSKSLGPRQFGPETTEKEMRAAFGEAAESATKTAEEHREKAGKYYDSVKNVFSGLEGDPARESLLQQKALEYLKTEDAEYFNREFSGELDEEGYLYKKDGTTSNTKPSQNIGGGLAMEKVMQMVRAELK